jgi:hypothetical protein
LFYKARIFLLYKIEKCILFIKAKAVMNVAGDANGIIMETRDSLYGFPGCSTNSYLVTPFCKGSAQQPAVSVILFFIKNEKPGSPSPSFRVLCGLLHGPCVYYFSQDRAICNCRETSTHPLCPAIGQCHGACCTHCMAYLRRSVPSFNFNFSFMWER